MRHGRRIDYHLLLTNLVSKTGADREIIRIYYYHCLPYQNNPPTPEQSAKLSSAQRFFRALQRTPRFEVRLGRLAYRGDDSEGKPIYEQKRVDLLLGIDLTLHSARHTLDEVLMIAGDSDFIPAIQAAKSSANMVVIKNPGILQIDFERAQFRKLLAEATKMFAAIDKDKNKWAYVYAPESDFIGMMENSLPSFWSPSLSKAYADAKPTTEIKTPKKTTKEDRVEKVKELRRQGFSLGEIAKIQGISKSTAKNYLDSYPYKKKLKIWPTG